MRPQVQKISTLLLITDLLCTLHGVIVLLACGCAYSAL